MKFDKMHSVSTLTKPRSTTLILGNLNYVGIFQHSKTCSTAGVCKRSYPTSDLNYPHDHLTFSALLCDSSSKIPGGNVKVHTPTKHKYLHWQQVEGLPLRPPTHSEAYHAIGGYRQIRCVGVASRSRTVTMKNQKSRRESSSFLRFFARPAQSNRQVSREAGE
jgi:hypothetical protein